MRLSDTQLFSSNMRRHSRGVPADRGGVEKVTMLPTSAIEAHAFSHYQRAGEGEILESTPSAIDAVFSVLGGKNHKTAERKVS